MGFFTREKLEPEYQGNPLAYTFLQNLLQAPGAPTQLGPLSQLAQTYMSDILSGKGLNVYEQGSPYSQYQQAALQNFQRNIAPQVIEPFAASGMLRGSSSQGAASKSLTDFSNTLQQQAYGAYQSGLGRQYGIAQFAPGLELQQQYAPIQAGLQSASLINQQYGLPQYEASGLSKLLGGLFNLGGMGLGAAGLAGGFGNLFNFKPRTQ
jgi:hypothetical protein